MAKVLLVEDDNNLREIYEARLSAEGYNIVTAEDGEEALVIAKKEKPDLIISDVMMPRISGFEMLDILRNTDGLKHTKIIMLTALGQSEDQTRANSLGADKYLVKSQVTLEDIVNSASQLLSDEGDAPAAETPAPAATPAPAPAETPAAPASTPVAAAPTPATPPASEPAGPAPAAPAPTPTPDPTPAPAAPASTPAAPATPVVPAPAQPSAPTPPPVSGPLSPTPAPAAPAGPGVTMMASTPMPVVEPPAPVSEPPQIQMPTPGATSTGSPATTGAEASVGDAGPQSLESEEAALQAQIDGYLKEPDTAAETPTPDPTPAPAPAETPAAPAPTDVAPAPSPASTGAGATNSAAAADAALIQQAVSNLATDSTPPTTDNMAPQVVAPEAAPALAPAAETPAPAATPAPVPAETPATPAAATDTPASSSGGAKKVLQPLSDPATKPNLDELLAKEEAAENANAPVPPAGPVTPPSPTVGGTTPDAPKSGDIGSMTL